MTTKQSKLALRVASVACASLVLLCRFSSSVSAFVIPTKSISSSVPGSVNKNKNIHSITNNKPQSSGPTSTTLYYRDDVPPIGSSPTWELPNDFGHFVTQCSVQSFLFLLDSLRDDPTQQWLNEFTEPVLLTSSERQRQQQQQAAANNKNNKKKITLAEAAQSAVDTTDQIMKAALQESPSSQSTALLEDTKTAPKPKKKVKKSQKKTPKTAKVITSKKKTTSSRLSLQNDQDLDEMPLPSFASRNLLENCISVANAFQSYARMQHKALSRLHHREEADKKKSKSSSRPSSLGHNQHHPYYNTDISALYSSSVKRRMIPRKFKAKNPNSSHGEAPSIKKNFSPFGNKPKAVRPTPMLNGMSNPMVGGAQTGPPNPMFAAPGSSNEIPKFATPGTSTGTSALYKAPEQNDKSSRPGNNDFSSSYNTARNNSTSATASEAATAKRKTVMNKYHGLAVFNRTKFPTWESYFTQLLEQPKASYIVESKLGEYDWDIDPASLCRRLLSVRQQIAEEFEYDLSVIADMGGLTLQSYQAMLREIREQRAEDELQQQKDALEQQMPPKSMEDSIASHSGAKATDDGDAAKDKKKNKPSVQRANLLFLDSGVPTSANKDCSPSPLRKGNFDLLVLLATQEAIHRVLNDPSRQARKSAEHGSNQFLQDFYVTRLWSHFSGDQKYGRADDFLEELLFSAPRMITLDGSSSGGKVDDMSSPASPPTGETSANEDGLTKDLTYLVDPVQVAKTILDQRQKVALEWKEQLEASKIKEEHLSIQRMALTKLMGETTEECRIYAVESEDEEERGVEGTDSCFE